MRPVIAAAVLALSLMAGPALGQTSAPAAPPAPGFSVVYDVHAKGLVVGQFSYAVKRNGQVYQAQADRRMTGLVRAIIGSKQDYRYSANGTVTEAGVHPVSYEHSGGKKNRRVQVTFMPNDIVTVATPPMGMGTPPATQAQKIGAMDQLSSIYAMAISSGDPCTRTMHIYLDGRSRFDLVMSPNGNEKVSSGAFKGTARRCSVQFKPIAGFDDPQPPATMSFLFASVGGLYAPIRIAMPTDDAGIVTLEARSFTLTNS